MFSFTLKNSGYVLFALMAALAGSLCVSVQFAHAATPVPVITLTATSPITGFPSYIKWSATNVTSCAMGTTTLAYHEISNAVTDASGQGSGTSDPVTNARGGGKSRGVSQNTFKLTCQSPAGVATKSVTVQTATISATGDSYPVNNNLYNIGGDIGACIELGWPFTFTPNPRVATFLMYSASDPSRATWANVDSKGAVTRGGYAPSVTSGQNVVVQWSCANTIYFSNLDGDRSTFLDEPECHYFSGYTTSYAQQMVVTGTLNNLQNTQTGGRFDGQQNVIVPANGELTQTFSCGTFPPVTLTLGAAKPSPIVTIAAVPTVVEKGKPSVITATYIPGAGDTLTATALNGPNTTNSVPGVTNVTATSPKVYTFTTNTPGTYTFSPAVKTDAYRSWDDLGKSVTVTVLNCGVGGHISGNACVCDTGYTGTPPSCVPPVKVSCALSPASQTIVRGSSATVRYTTTGGPTAASYSVDGGASTGIAPIGASGTITVPSSAISTVGTHTVQMSVADLTASAGCGPVTIKTTVPGNLTAPVINSFSSTKINPGKSSMLSWTISNMQAGVLCSITPSAKLGGPMPGWNGSAIWNGSVLTSPITTPTSYTLSCDYGKGVVSAVATVQLLPAYIEI